MNKKSCIISEGNIITSVKAYERANHTEEEIHHKAIEQTQ